MLDCRVAIDAIKTADLLASYSSSSLASAGFFYFKREEKGRYDLHTTSSEHGDGGLWLRAVAVRRESCASN
jgi:hypothetical protein